MTSMPTLHAIAAASSPVRFAAGEAVGYGSFPSLYVLAAGEAAIFADERRIEGIGPGGHIGEERILYERCCILEAVATTACAAYRVPSDPLVQSPLLHWRLREACDRRLALARTAFGFDWRDEYSVGMEELDSQHRGMFAAIDELARRMLSAGEGAVEALSELEARAARHYRIEELYMSRWSYPGLEAHEEAHAEILAEMDGFKARLEARREAHLESGAVESEAAELTAFLKDCLLRHTLLADRLYMPYIKNS
jgi:hemerythrin